MELVICTKELICVLKNLYVQTDSNMKDTLGIQHAIKLLHEFNNVT